MKDKFQAWPSPEKQILQDPEAQDEACDTDMVNHPPHYNQGKIEVIEALEDWNLEPHEWNAVKYVARAHLKGKRIEDLKKAIWYLQRKIALLQGDAPRPNEMQEYLAHTEEARSRNE